MAVARPRARVEPVEPDQIRVTPELARKVWREGKFAQDPTRYDNRVSPNLSITSGQFADLSVPERAYGQGSIPTGAYKDTSITNGKLAANAGDARTQSDGSITTNYNGDGTPARSHLAANAVGRFAIQSDASNNNLRGVPSDALRDSLLKSRHFPTATGPIVNSADIFALAAQKLTGTLPGGVFGSDTVPSAAVISLHGSRLETNSVSGGPIQAGVISGNHLVPGLKSPAQGIEGLRIIGTFWGGSSVNAASANHSHSTSFKELPPTMRKKIQASRMRLHQNLRPKSEMLSETKDQLVKRVWLLERQMAAVLHMLCDDPERPTSTREARIAVGAERDTWLDRYAPLGRTYEELHPEATHFFSTFSEEEMAA